MKKTVVTFPDPALEAAIRDTIEKPDGDILTTDLAGLTVFSANDIDITDLTGIEYCTDLTQLGLANNQIVNINPLASLTKLTGLYLDNNQIADIRPLTGLTKLTQLYLSDNQITDIRPLASLTKLTWLNLTGNRIADESIADLCAALPHCQIYG